MTEKQIESSENHYNDYLRSSQECFGLSYTNGQPCNVCDDKKECSEKYFLSHPSEKPMLPTTCEYENRWETHCISNQSSDSRDFACFVSYSCALLFCKYPRRECRVKR